MHRLRTWLRKYWMAALLGVNFAVAGYVFALPLTYDYSPVPQLEERMRIAVALLGVFSFGAERLYRAMAFFPDEYVISHYSFYLFNQPYASFTIAVLLIVSGSAVSIFLWLLLRSMKTRKIALWILSANLGIALLQAALLLLGYFNIVTGFPNEMRYPSGNECVRSLSDNISIRVLVLEKRYSTPDGISGSPEEISYSISNDSGRAWREFMRLIPGPHICEQIRALDDDLIWIWDRAILFTSRDGGKNWHIWNIQEAEIEPGLAGYRIWRAPSIVDVTFENHTAGRMQIEYVIHDQSLPPVSKLVTRTLLTTDGGRTWTLSEETYSDGENPK